MPNATQTAAMVPGLDDQEQRPAVEKSPQRPQRLAQVDVLAAGLRHHGGQFAVAERADHGQNAGDDPRAKNQRRRVGSPRDVGIHKKNAGPDHGPGNERGGTEQPKRLHHPGRFVGGGAEFSIAVSSGVCTALVLSEFKTIVSRNFVLQRSVNLNPMELAELVFPPSEFGRRIGGAKNRLRDGDHIHSRVENRLRGLKRDSAQPRSAQRRAPPPSRSFRTPSTPIGFLRGLLGSGLEYRPNREVVRRFSEDLRQQRFAAAERADDFLRTEEPPRLAWRHVPAIKVDAVKSNLKNEILPVIENQLHLLRGHGLTQGHGFLHKIAG